MRQQDSGWLIHNSALTMPMWTVTAHQYTMHQPHGRHMDESHSSITTVDVELTSPSLVNSFVWRITEQNPSELNCSLFRFSS